MSSVIRLERSWFSSNTVSVLSAFDITVEIGRFATNVEFIRVTNSRGHVVFLPFLGFQIWNATWDNKVCGMKSPFEYPRPVDNLLDSYGALLVHCGITGIGNPGPNDRHALHGELPFLQYDEVWLAINRQNSISINGRRRLTRAFHYDFLIEPSFEIDRGSTLVVSHMKVTNVGDVISGYMYLAHINFALENGVRICHQKLGSGGITVREKQVVEVNGPRNEEDLIQLESGTRNILNVIRESHVYFPEVVAFLDLEPEEDGWVHVVAEYPDGDYRVVAYHAAELPHCVRWITRSSSMEAFGMALPATAQTEGRETEEAKGNVKYLANGESVVFNCRFGMISGEEQKTLGKECW